MKTYIKDALTVIESKNAEEIKNILPQALSEVDRAATKGIIHPNSAARKKSMLQRRAAAVK
jgi:small subunit ribosomal protein S20